MISTSDIAGRAARKLASLPPMRKPASAAGIVVTLIMLAASVFSVVQSVRLNTRIAAQGRALATTLRTAAAITERATAHERHLAHEAQRLKTINDEWDALRRDVAGRLSTEPVCRDKSVSTR